MMKFIGVCCALALMCAGSTAFAARISGDYIEARTCDVYTGPCFANGEIGLTGREAVLAWKVDKGEWNGVSLKGLGAALVLKASDTLGKNASFNSHPQPIKSVILVDEQASPEQREALVAFVRESAGELADEVVRVDSAPITLTADHLTGRGVLKAGEAARIETRGVRKGDCVCTNETVFYPPLTKVENVQPAFSLQAGYEGAGLNSTWLTVGNRGAFLATFRR
ncbi:MAG TPA: DUF1326 domain-containing protein [Planctomycetaceae bacterium]|nr:DUF1326 domain-containing protein [Planctomycetaceae bacterium]